MWDFRAEAGESVRWGEQAIIHAKPRHFQRQFAFERERSAQEPAGRVEYLPKTNGRQPLARRCAILRLARPGGAPSGVHPLAGAVHWTAFGFRLAPVADISATSTRTALKLHVSKWMGSSDTGG
jgi:hypothetical protein